MRKDTKDKIRLTIIGVVIAFLYILNLFYGCEMHLMERMERWDKGMTGLCPTDSSH